MSELRKDVDLILKEMGRILKDDLIARPLSDAEYAAIVNEVGSSLDELADTTIDMRRYHEDRKGRADPR